MITLEKLIEGLESGKLKLTGEVRGEILFHLHQAEELKANWYNMNKRLMEFGAKVVELQAELERGKNEL